MAKKQWKTHIMVSQVTADMQEAVPIAEYRLMDTWERLERVFFVRANKPEPPIQPYQVWIEKRDENGGWPEEEKRIVISPSQGKWFLQDFLREPKSIWGQIQQEVS